MSKEHIRKWEENEKKQVLKMREKTCFEKEVNGSGWIRKTKV